MKLRYNFEIMEMDDQFVAVPVGDNASELHGIVKFNSTGAEILNLIKKEKSDEDIVNELNEKYDSSVDEIQRFVAEFLEQMKEAGLAE